MANDELKAAAQKELLRRSAVAELQRRAQIAEPRSQIEETQTALPVGNPSVDSFPSTVTNYALGGLPDKVNAAGLGVIQGGIVDPLMGRGFNVGGRYNEILNSERDNHAAYETANPNTALAAKIASVPVGMVMLPGGGSGIKGAAQTAAAYGGVLGAAQDSDTVGGHLLKAGLGTIEGGVLGAGTAAAIKYAPAAVKAVAAPLSGYLYPENTANTILTNAVLKSGKKIADVQAAINQAGAEGQPMFNTADALGERGQSLLSTVARSPSDKQAVIADALINRQMDQSGRVGGFIKSGLGANQTADQAVEALTKARGAVANKNYSAARNGAGPVDLTDTINTIDNLLGPGAKFDVGISPDTTEGALIGIRSQLAAGDKSGITSRSDFETLLRQKGDLADKVDSLYRAGKNNQANALKEVVKKLDKALEAASPAYRQANDTFSQMSRPIDAVDIGKQAARPSSRAADTIQTYSKLDPVSQQAFKTGYADPILARIENAPNTSNVARPFTAPKATQEFGAIAQDPSLLGRQLSRENIMHATLQRALGGSKTADNLINESELSAISPSEFMQASRGGLTGLVSLLVSKGGNFMTGKNANVRSLLAEKLLGNNPAQFIAALEKSRLASEAKRMATIKALAPMIGLEVGRAQ